MTILTKSKILKMELASFLILTAACFLRPVTPKCLEQSQMIICEKTRQNYTAVPLLPNNVSILHLGYNHISLNEKDVEVLHNYTSITELYLDNNAISVVRNYSFSRLSELAVLNISNNSIHTVQLAAFAGLHKLMVLNLQNNQIVQLDSNPFVLLKNLKNLNLQNNLLENFDTKVSFNLARISLTGNPWNCSCGLLSLQIWLSNAKVSVENENNTVCAAPNSLKRHPIKTAAIKQCEKMEMTEPTPSDSSRNNTTSGNETYGNRLYAEHHAVKKSWSFVMGGLIIVICTSLLTLSAIKFPAWYRYLISYNHRRLNEEEPQMFEETFTPHMCTYPQTTETDKDSTVGFEQFHAFVPEEDGFIEDKYIDT